MWHKQKGPSRTECKSCILHLHILIMQGLCTVDYTLTILYGQKIIMIQIFLFNNQRVNFLGVVSQYWCISGKDQGASDANSHEVYYTMQANNCIDSQNNGTFCSSGKLECSCITSECAATHNIDFNFIYLSFLFFYFAFCLFFNSSCSSKCANIFLEFPIF